MGGRGKREPVELDRVLWLSFGLLFVGMIATVWLPVDPIVWGLPLWATVALALMLASVVVAAIAGVYYGWPARSATDARTEAGGEPR